MKQKAKYWEMSEAELIRHAIDHLEERPVPEEARRRAWEKLHAFAEERARMRVPQTGRTWTRDDIYEDRLAKWGPDLYDLAGRPIPSARQESEE